MVDKRLVAGVAILVIVFLGFMFISNTTGNVITGSVANEEVVENDLFRIDEVENKTMEEDINDTQNNSESG